VQIAGPGLLQTTTTLSAGPFSGTLGAGTYVHDYSSSGVTVSSTKDAQSADFSHYTGSGLVSINLAGNSPAATFQGSAAPGVFFGGYADSYGSLEVQYVYTAVPEPGTLCTGFAALGSCLLKLTRRSRYTYS
jgi:hypothetical protein